MKAGKNVPLSMVTLVFGALSIPLAFARQLCVPALIMGLLAMAFRLWGQRKQSAGTYTAGSIKRSRLGFKLAVVGSICAVVMWVLWGSGTLL